jgi:hypothetical protein
MNIIRINSQVDAVAVTECYIFNSMWKQKIQYVRVTCPW